MGMSTYVQGFVSKENETYKKHEKVLLACNDAGVSIPKETAEYFGTDDSSDYVLEEFLERTIPQHEWNDGDMCNGYEIKVSEIPEGVEVIRFVNSW